MVNVTVKPQKNDKNGQNCQVMKRDDGMVAFARTNFMTPGTYAYSDQFFGGYPWKQDKPKTPTAPMAQPQYGQTTPMAQPYPQAAPQPMPSPMAAPLPQAQVPVAQNPPVDKTMLLINAVNQMGDKICQNLDKWGQALLNQMAKSDGTLNDSISFLLSKQWETKEIQAFQAIQQQQAQRQEVLDQGQTQFINQTPTPTTGPAETATDDEPF